jgi:hypothetical protein
MSNRSSIIRSRSSGASEYLLKLSDVNITSRTPARFAARRLSVVVSTGWLRICRPATLMTEQKLQVNGQPRAG